MFRRMIPILLGHEVCQGDAKKTGVCNACVQGKMINRPSRWKLPTELPPRLHRLHGDTYGSITPALGPFKYFMVLVDVAGIYFEVSLLSTRNIMFSKLLAMLIKFRTHYPNFPVKTLRMDNVQGFKSQHFEDYCMATRIELTYSVSYEHSQNGLAKAFIKKIQLISRPLLIQAGLPSYFWEHAVLHVATLLRYRPTLLNDFSPLELLSGQKPDVSHFRVFGCQVWVPIVEPKRITISHYRIENVYVGFDSPNVIRYLIPSIGVLHKARFQNCKFDETTFPSVTTSKPNAPLDFWAPKTLTLNLDPRIALTNTEVKKVLGLKTLAEKLPDEFTNIPRVARNPLPGAGLAPLSIRPERQPVEKPPAKKSQVSNLSDVIPPSEPIESEPLLCTSAEQEQVMSFVQDITSLENDHLTLDEAKASPDWAKWQTTLQAEYQSLRKHNVFGPLVTTLTTRPVGHKLIFVKKRNAQGEIVWYKMCLQGVAQGFTQRPGINFQFTFSPVMDSGTFRYLLGMAVQYSLDTQLLDVVTAYLYGPLDAQLYIRPPPEFLEQVPPEDTPNTYSRLCLQKAFYGLKQAGRMWYKHLRDFLLFHNFSYYQALPCLFTLQHSSGFVVIAVYVNDLNLVGTPATCQHAMTLLTNQFEMKLLGKTSFCLGLQLSHVPGGGIFLHQTTYTQKLLKRFGMDKANPLSAPMTSYSKTSDDPYTPCKEEEEEFHNKTQYLTAVGALLYLSTYIRPNISFAVSVLAQHSQRPSICHWNGIKHLLHYLRGTEDLELLYTKGRQEEITRYADVGFRSDEISDKSQTGYIFLKNNAPITWKLVKQIVTATSTNHSELVAFHEAARESIWLKNMDKIIKGQCGLNQDNKPTVIYEDNATYVAQVGEGFIKSNRVKHIPPQLFGFTQELIQNKQIEVKKVESFQNIADMLTKALPAYTHKWLVFQVGMRLYHKITAK